MLASRQATSLNTAPHSGGRRRLGRHAAMMETVAVTLCLLQVLCLNVFIPIFIYRSHYGHNSSPEHLVPHTHSNNRLSGIISQ